MSHQSLIMAENPSTEHAKEFLVNFYPHNFVAPSVGWAQTAFPNHALKSYIKIYDDRANGLPFAKVFLAHNYHVFRPILLIYSRIVYLSPGMLCTQFSVEVKIQVNFKVLLIVLFFSLCKLTKIHPGRLLRSKSLRFFFFFFFGKVHWAGLVCEITSQWDLWCERPFQNWAFGPANYSATICLIGLILLGKHMPHFQW